MMESSAAKWLLAATAACGGPADSVIEPGRLEFYDYQPMIDVPSSATSGVSINMTVRTYGGGCISFESTDVAVTHDGADVYVYDRRRIPGESEACTLDLVFIPHDAMLTFTTPGTKTIHIHGRRYVPPIDEPLMIVKEVLVH
jgi:hypothetical protein